MKPAVAGPLSAILGDQRAVVQGRAGEVGAKSITGEVGDGGNPDPLGRRLDGYRYAVQRKPVVDATAAGLRHAVRSDDVDLGSFGSRSERRIQCGAAHQHRVQSTQRLAEVWLIQRTVQLRWHHREIATPTHGADR